MELKRNEDAEKIFAIYRDYIEHEDELIHQRSTSLITIQSFILATFGFTYQKKYEVAAKILVEKDKKPIDLGSINNEYNGFLLALALVGVATSFIAWRSVRAAKHALEALSILWSEHAKSLDVKYLPEITGGGNGSASKDGISLATWAPLFLLGFWLVTLFALLFVFDVRINFR